jgi:hypothetical protein
MSQAVSTLPLEGLLRRDSPAQPMPSLQRIGVNLHAPVEVQVSASGEIANGISGRQVVVRNTIHGALQCDGTRTWKTARISSLSLRTVRGLDATGNEPRVVAFLSSHAHPAEASICSRRFGDPVPGSSTDSAAVHVYQFATVSLQCATSDGKAFSILKGKDPCRHETFKLIGSKHELVVRFTHTNLK